MIEQQLTLTREASRSLVRISAEQMAKVIAEIADTLEDSATQIVAENAKDLARMSPSDPKYDRLLLTPERISGIAADARKVASLSAPCGEVIEQRTLPNQLLLKKVRVPLGVVGVIYEARPNVTIDVATLCLRSGNAVVLKGGSDAANSNAIMVDLMHDVLQRNNININLIQLLPPAREAATELMNAVGYIDVLIPRGSRGLIDSVRQQAKVPVIETGAGVVHTYFDKDGDLQIATNIVCNAKTRRVSVCNALDCLIIHSSRLADLHILARPLCDKGVGIYADERAYNALVSNYDTNLLHHATPDDFGREFLSLNMAIKTVDSFDEALNHIYTYGLKHSESIATNNAETAQRFVNEVDAACVYVNASTAFTDGAQFGLGAEIGISTQKLHARGPMALKELTSYKWQIFGNGQIRS